MINVPLGLTFQASCAVSAGIGAIGCGYIDIGSLLFLGFILLLLSYYYFFHSPAESCGGSRFFCCGHCRLRRQCPQQKNPREPPKVVRSPEWLRFRKITRLTGVRPIPRIS